MDIEVLRHTPLFAMLDDDTFQVLVGELAEIQLARGEVLFHEGDQGNQLYFITSGKIKLGRSSADGRENLLSVLGPGDMFGELSLFDPAPRSATATAVAETRLASLSNDALHRLLLGRPEASTQLLKALAHRIRRTNDSLADLVFSDVPGRVAKALIDLSQRFGKPVSEGILVAHDLTQEELAQLVGASRETVNKALADFVQRGWLRLEARAVVVLDEHKLSNRAR